MAAQYNSASVSDVLTHGLDALISGAESKLFGSGGSAPAQTVQSNTNGNALSNPLVWLGIFGAVAAVVVIARG